MPSLSLSSLLLLASTLISSTLALPSPSPTPSKSHGVVQLRGHKLSRRDTGLGAVAQDADGVYWTTPVLLGGQEFQLLIDTGSSSLWVFGEKAPNPSSRTIYYGTPTSSYADGLVFNQSYSSPGDWVSGHVSIDTVSVAGISIPNTYICTTDQAGPLELEGLTYDGIIGLHRGTQWRVDGGVSEDGGEWEPNTWFEDAVLGGYLDWNVLAMRLRGEGEGATGTLEIGGWDEGAWRGELVSVGVDGEDPGAWVVGGVMFGVGDGGFEMLMNVDSGSTYTGVDPSVAAAYWAQVSGAVDVNGDSSTWQYPCDTALPNFVMYFNGNEVIIPGSLLNRGAVDDESNLCYGGIRGREGGRGVVGSAFFLAYYVVFNYEGPVVQFAPQA